MCATMFGWWTVSTAAKSRALNASSPFFMSASRCAVRVALSVMVAMRSPSVSSSRYQLRREGSGVIGGELFEGPRRPAKNRGDVAGHVVTIALCHQSDDVGIVLGHVLRKSHVEHRLLLLSHRDRMEGDRSAEHSREDRRHLFCRGDT